jgi:hypothetical protein
MFAEQSKHEALYTWTCSYNVIKAEVRKFIMYM